MTSVLWLRRDLRRRDHPALLAARDAAGDGDLVVAFVVDPRLWEGGGAARRAWLAATLEATDEAFDGALTLLHGDPRRVVPELAARVGAILGARLARDHPGRAAAATRSWRRGWREAGVEWVETGTPYAVGPGLVVNGSGEPYKVFTPFSKAWRAHGWPDPAPTPRELPLRHARNDADATAAVKAALAAPDLPDLPDRRGGGRAARGGGRSATARSRHTPTTATDPTSTARHGSRPTSSSVSLHPRTLLADLAGERGQGRARPTRTSWPGASSTPTCCGTSRARAWHDLRPEMSRMRYDEPEDAIEAWRAGRTGYPIVDAGHAPAARARAGCTTGCG